MIPSFLKPENAKPISKENIALRDALTNYEKHFGVSISTETLTFDNAELIKLLNKSVEKNIALPKVFSDPDDENTLY